MGRSYTNEEDRTRFGIFVDNLKIIDERNSLETNTAIHGINKFTDLSHDEFKERYLTAHRPSSGAKRTVVDYVKPIEGADSLVDWTGVYTTPVKDQVSSN